MELQDLASIHLSNLEKPFWPRLNISKGDLLRYYLNISDVLLPHLRDRAMVMKRYPDGVEGPSFYMKRTPTPRSQWLRTCSITHASGSVIDFPMVQDVPSLMWLVNLGCIDLHPWYARCDDVQRPDFLNFDLDPGEAPWERVVEAGFLLRELLERQGAPTFVKTSGSKGLHVYVPLRRGPTQKEVWAVAKVIAMELATRHPKLMTAQYRIAKRPAGRVLVDYNQNAWGRTLASVYSVRPRPTPTVSTPVTWRELESGVGIEDFTLETVPGRLKKRGDLWAPLLAKKGRVALSKFL